MKPRLSRKARVGPTRATASPSCSRRSGACASATTAAAIVALCDGTRELDAIVDELRGALRRRPRARGG